MRFLLTGASGFLGRHCLDQLVARGHEVHAVSSKELDPDQQLAPPVHWHRTDLLNAAQTASLLCEVKPSHLLHLAWYTVPGKYWTSLENFGWVQASLTLVQLFSEHGGERMVIAGTCAEYDWTNGVCSEQTTPLRPATLYGTCKHALHLMLESYAIQAGLSAAWARLFFIYGPYEYPDRLIPAVIGSLLRKEAVPCSYGNQQRDFLYVEDAAAALVSLLNSEVSGPVNIASGKAVALKTIVCRIAQKLGRADPVELDAISGAVGDNPLVVANVKRLQNEVGWMPRFDLDQGLAETINWWKSQ